MQRSALSEAKPIITSAICCIHGGRDNDAERYLKQAIVLDPGFTPTVCFAGRALRSPAPLCGGEEVPPESDFFAADLPRSLSSCVCIEPRTHVR